LRDYSADGIGTEKGQSDPKQLDVEKSVLQTMNCVPQSDWCTVVKNIDGELIKVQSDGEGEDCFGEILESILVLPLVWNI
jgi:hypothetical protein